MNETANVSHGHMSVQDYIAIFQDLTHRSDVREYYSESITRFVWSLQSKIRRAMIIALMI